MQRSHLHNVRPTGTKRMDIHLLAFDRHSHYKLVDCKSVISLNEIACKFVLVVHQYSFIPFECFVSKKKTNAIFRGIIGAHIAYRKLTHYKFNALSTNV
jgi:hypothetical protein